MKNIVFIIILILTNSSANYSQWYQQVSGTNAGLYDVHFINQNIGWVVGDYNNILKTTDGGATWIMQYNGGSSVLFGVFFVDSLKGTAVGGTPTNTQLLRTTNSGEDWLNQYPGYYGILRSVFFTDINNGWIVGDYGTILRTINGINWYTQNSGTTAHLNDVFFTDVNNGIIAGNSGVILKTTNSGQDWIPVSSGTGVYLISISFVDENNGWITGGSGTILRTTNGGDTWFTQYMGTPSFLYGVFFTDTSKGWVVGSGGTIRHTTTGGYSWTTQTVGTGVAIFGVHFINSLIGTAVGNDGVILRTIDGGVPVELASFTAEVFESTVELNWTTVTETNNSGFEIEKTSPFPSPYQGDGGEAGRGWENIGFVQGHGTTTEPQFYSFIDETVQHGTYQYRLKQIDFDGSFEYSEIVEVTVEGPTEFSLSQNYPNPFNPTTKIKYTVPTPPVSSPLVKGRTKEAFVSLKAYDVLGSEVATLVNEEKPAGEYEVEFDGTNLPSGIYFYQLLVSALQSKDGRADSFVQTKKMVLLK